MTGDQLLDVRRHAALRAFGSYRMLLSIHAALEDLDGAIANGQHEVAWIAGREVVTEAASIFSLAVAGEPDFDCDDLAFDAFAGLSAAEDAEVEELVLAGPGCTSVEELRAWSERIGEYVRRAEALLGHAEPLRSVRSPDGLFPAPRLARVWTPVVEAMELPSLLPSSWTDGDDHPEVT